MMGMERKQKGARQLKSSMPKTLPAQNALVPPACHQAVHSQRCDETSGVMRGGAEEEEGGAEGGALQCEPQMAQNNIVIVIIIIIIIIATIIIIRTIGKLCHEEPDPTTSTP